jgi:hypothetical protein
MAEILPFFAVPFGFAKLDNCGPLNQELRTLFLARSAEGGEHANPRPLTQRNPQVFESNFGLFRSTERPLQQLKEFCWRHLIKFVCDLNGYDDLMRSRLLICSDAWFHVTRRGGFFGLHNHPNASWSGVYCVDPGQRGSGLLSILCSPRACMSMLRTPACAARLPPVCARSIWSRASWCCFRRGCCTTSSRTTATASASASRSTAGSS